MKIEKPLSTNIIIYRELPKNRLLEVKVFDTYVQYTNFIEEFLKEKETYVLSHYTNEFNINAEEVLDVNEKEDEIKMTPWESIDFIKFEHVFAGGEHIGYID